MASNRSWYALEERNEGSELMDESKNIAAVSSVADRRLGSPTDGPPPRYISSHGELEVSDSRYYVDKDEFEDMGRYIQHSNTIYCSETNAQTCISVPMENYLHSNTHEEDPFVGFGVPGSDARGSSRSPWNKKPSIWIDEPGKASSSLEPILYSICPTGVPSYKPRSDSRARKRRRHFSIEDRKAVLAARRAGACKDCRRRHTKVIKTPYWLMNPITYT